MGELEVEEHLPDLVVLCGGVVDVSAKELAMSCRDRNRMVDDCRRARVCKIDRWHAS